MPSSACDWSSDVCSSDRSEEHTSELQSRSDLVCRLLLEKKKHTSELQSRSDLVCRLLLGQKKNTYHLQSRSDVVCRLVLARENISDKLGLVMMAVVYMHDPHALTILLFSGPLYYIFCLINTIVSFSCYITVPLIFFFFLIILRHPRSPLFPYPSLFFFF